MSDSLAVNPDFLGVLANAQEQAAAYVQSATETVAGIAEDVETTHGSYTSKFTTTLTALATIRNSVGTSLYALGGEVASNLRLAAKAYSEADDVLAELMEKIKFSS
ncbi:ESX-1 secretion-associated protein [Mycobacterium gordonae]|uniref:ESX-1 secretion-associated protein n=1 Tax=Mycobacterium gordonae TaxID=1778 RepID=A0A1X1VND1_MYCGO|nr:ESX-1 secretion-associated protein [Mycobacterium gordonae]MCV7010568.1 ESX-1 secretion-associated protein [Mycobacterium gordonae]ODR17385.1 hypothetical protein BHQ23_26605 [Mycobacterium gordonae]ORV70564.1 hypothetical protein AWC08_05220 [Mycobacterium gordonae]